MKPRFCACCVFPFILVVAFGILLYPVLQRAENNYYNYDRGCRSNLKQIALGIFMYSQDYDGKLPPAIFPGKTVGWANGLQPYVQSYGLFQCPLEEYNEDHSSLIVEIHRMLVGSSADHSQENPPQPDQPGFTNYWLNSNLSGMPKKRILSAGQVIMLGDGDSGAPTSTASYIINKLPTEWRTSPDSPAKRHSGGANYAFLDGHVKWLKPNQVSELPSSKKHPHFTFSIK